MPALKVFLSSTFRDLKKYRRAASSAISDEEMAAVQMEKWPAEPRASLQLCKEKVAECDLFVGILGHLFGNTPRGLEKSFTQIEYETARQLKLPRLMFLASRPVRVPRGVPSDPVSRARQVLFRDEVQRDRHVTLAMFKDPPALQNAVSRALARYLIRRGHEASRLRSRSSADSSHTGSGSDHPAAATSSGTRGFLRRRCRVFLKGSTAFDRLSRELIDCRARPEQYDQLFRAALGLYSSYERSMVCAMIHEDQGHVAEALKALDTVRLAGEEECSRRLFRAVLLDKLGDPSDLDHALAELAWVLHSTKDGDIQTAAQFNVFVCNEKLGRFDRVDFGRFLSDRKRTLSSGQLLWCKALSGELIVCAQTGTPFRYQDLVPQALQVESTRSPSGYVKTLVNWSLYRQQLLTKAELKKLKRLELRMSVTQRAAFLYHLIRQSRLGRDAVTRNSLVRTLRRLQRQSPSRAILKFTV